MRHLDFFKKVDSHRVGMALPGQKDLDEVGQNTQLNQIARRLPRIHRHRFVRFVLPLAAFNKIFLPDPFRQRRHGELPHRAPQVPTRIAVLKTPGKNQIDRRPRHHAHLAVTRNRPGQPPPGHTGAHPALNDAGQRV